MKSFLFLTLLPVLSLAECHRKFVDFTQVPVGTSPPNGYGHVNWEGWNVTTMTDGLTPNSPTKYAQIVGGDNFYGLITVPDPQKIDLYANINSFYFGCAGYNANGKNTPGACTITVTTSYLLEGRQRYAAQYNFTGASGAMTKAVAPEYPGIYGDRIWFSLSSASSAFDVLYIDDIRLTVADLTGGCGD